MILKFKKLMLSKQRTCIEIGESKLMDCFLLYYLMWFNVMVIGVAPNYTAIGEKRKNNGLV